MKFTHLLFLFFLCLTSINLSAQSGYTISGVVNESDGKALPFANILLLKTVDSTLVKGTVTTEEGTYQFKSIPKGNYMILASMVGYQSVYSKPFELNVNFQVDKIILLSGESLDEIVVKADKPLYQQKVDRMVINVENSIVSAGGSALEILERSPGVIVNRQSNAISVVGKDGVVVMINGKRSYVPIESIVQMLEGMSANNISSIELITTPPANFDAEGNAGFINIVLKERTDVGLNGSYSFSGGYGEGETTSDNINFNYREDKLNLFGSYSFSLDKRDQIISTSREFEQNGFLLGTFTETDREPTQRNHNVRLGLDIDVSKKTVMGVLLNGYDNRWSMDAFNESFDTENSSPNAFVDLVNDEVNQWKHFGANYNIKHNFTDDEFISFDVDYLYYDNENPTNYTNSFFDADRDFLNEELLRSGKETSLGTWVGKFDYSNQINKKIKVETGIKGTFSDFDNRVTVEDFIGNAWVFDPDLTNTSILEEKILAAYAASDYKITDKTSVKLGLRYEFTDTKLDVDTEGTVVDREYGIFFPSAFVNHKFNENLSMNLSYSKRITRPTFNDLAPFVIFFDPTTFLSGNAALQPAISNSFKYDLNYKSYIFSLQYTNEDESIANFQERIDEATGRLIFEAANLDYTKTFSITAGFPLKLFNWWRTQNNLNYFDQKVRAFYEGEPIELNLGNFNLNTIHSFKISEKTSAEASLFYTSDGFFGTAKYDGFYRVDAGMSHKFSDKWGTLKFAVNDIFDSVEFTGGTNLPEQNIRTRNLFDFINRTFTLTYTRSFGNSNVKSSRDRKTGADEERRRVN